MKVTSAAKVGFTAVVIALVLLTIFKGMKVGIPWLTGSMPGTYTIYANFKTVKGLNPGVDVQLNGNPVGQVGDIENDSFGGVTVALKIKDKFQIHENAKFTISRDSIFGSYMVTISEPRAGWVHSQPDSKNLMLRMEKGAVEIDGLVLLNEDVVGKIIHIETLDQMSDRVSVEILDDSVKFDSFMAFVPSKYTATGPTGVRIYRPIPPDATVVGDREPGPEDLVVTASDALSSITDQADQIMGRLVVLLDEVSEIIDAEDIHSLLETLMTEAKGVADNIERLTARLDATLAETSPHIVETMKNVEGLSADSRQLVQDLATKINDPQINEDLRLILRNLADASDAVNRILTDLEKYSSDEDLHEKITQTIDQAHATLEEAQKTLNKASGAIDDVSSRITEIGTIDAGGEFKIRYNEKENNYHGDFEFWIGSDASDLFFTAGVDDIGESERAHLQLGLRLNEDFSVRAGIRRGKVGAGLDWRSDALRFMTNLYDPNDLTWDIYGGYAVMDELDLIIGVEDLLDDDEFNVGLAYRF